MGQFGNARPDRSRCDRAPAARGVVIGGGGVLGHGHARAHFIAHDHGCQKFRAAAGFGRQGQHGRQQGAADMALGRVETIVPIQAVDCHARRHGGGGRVGVARVKQQGGCARHIQSGMIADNARQLRAQPPGGHPQKIQQRSLGALQHIGWNVAWRKPMNEMQGIGMHAWLLLPNLPMGLVAPSLAPFRKAKPCFRDI